jgi:hypothetical protein
MIVSWPAILVWSLVFLMAGFVAGALAMAKSAQFIGELELWRLMRATRRLTRGIEESRRKP